MKKILIKFVVIVNDIKVYYILNGPATQLIKN